MIFLLLTALSFYTQGENASTLYEREQAFNKALKEYLALEKTDAVISGNGLLYDAIGNTFYQLDDTPLAILYYLKSVQLRPRDTQTWDHLELAKERLNLTEAIHVFPISIPERLQLMSLFAVVSFLFFSFWLWRGKGKYGAYFCLALSCLFLLSALYSRYVEPLSAVVIVASPLYLGPGPSYAPVTPSPLKPGQVINILDRINGGAWLKVETQDGQIGFIRANQSRIV